VSQDIDDGVTIAPGVAILTPRIDIGSHCAKGQATDGVAELKSTYPDGLGTITAIGLHSREYLSKKNLSRVSKDPSFTIEYVDSPFSKA
jgi:hypothetical protein